MNLTKLIPFAFIFFLTACTMLDNSYEELWTINQCNGDIPQYCNDCTFESDFIDYQKNELQSKEVGIVFDNAFTGKFWFVDTESPDYDIEQYVFDSYRVFEQSNVDEFSVNSFHNDYEQVIFYELDTTLLEPMTEKEYAMLVKNKMLEVIACLRESENFEEKYSYLIFEGYAYRNHELEPVYETDDNKEKGSLEKLHYLEYKFENIETRDYFIIEYDDLAERNYNGVLDNTLRFVIRVG